MVRAALCRRCLTAVGHYFAYFGPSVDDQAVSLSDDGTTIIIDFFSFLFSLLSTAITVLPERVVVGFPNFAWAADT